MSGAASLFWRTITAADFFNIERSPDAAPVGGGGQTYISISFRGLTYVELGSFLGLGDPTLIGSTRPKVVLPAVASIVDAAAVAPLEFAPRYQPPQSDDRYRISRQNRQAPAQLRHPAWTGAVGFPLAPDDVTSAHDPMLPDLTFLKVIVIRDVNDQYFAGFVNSNNRPASWPTRLSQLFLPNDVTYSAGVIDFAPGELDMDNLVAGYAQAAGLAGAISSPEVADALEGTRIAAGRHPSGQRYRQDPEERKVIELNAMERVRKVLEGDKWKVEDVSGYRSYDFHCSRAGVELRVEVKGTTGDGASVLLTPGEVAHAREHDGSVALAIVSQIVVSGVPGGKTANGGVCTISYPWSIDSDGTLEPTGYQYLLHQPGDPC